MSEVLYRKYRPQSFEEVINQEATKTILKNALIHGRVSHAYLFTGPRGVGKTSVARILAKAVSCKKQKKGEPDNKCDHCKLIQEGRFLDLLEIDAASYTGVDNIRDIIDQVRFVPSLGKYKIIIIDEVHMLSKAAFNALLKTLEEPPEHAIFILATTEIHKVPATIISRTQRFDFRTVAQADILKLFDRVLKDQKVKISDEALRLIAQAAAGSFRDGLSILDQMLSMAKDEVTLEDVEEILGITRVEAHQSFLGYILANDTSEALTYIRDLAFEGKDLVLFSRDLLEYLRLVLFIKMGVETAESLGFAPEDGMKLTQQAEKISGKRLLEIIKAVLEAHRESKVAPVPELPLLMSAISLTEEIDAAVKKEETVDKKDKVSPVSESLKARKLDHGTVVDRWADVLSRVKEYNHSLITSLRLGRIVNLDEKYLTLALPYNFHKEIVEARKNKIVIEQVLEDVFQEHIKVKVYTERELKDSGIIKADQQDLMSEAMKVLGDSKAE